MERLKAHDIIDSALKRACIEVESNLDSDVLLLKSPILMGIDDIIKYEVEKIASSNEAKASLAVIIETNGGLIETVERLHKVFRQNYQIVKFIIPNFAYSAGTVLVLSGDEIWMDYYSVLGPIDPQVQRDGRLLPGIGYLQKYKELIQKSHSENGLSDAEIEFLVRKFDPAELFALEQAKNHSVSLLESWLVEYKFKDWEVRETSREEVTEEYKKERANRIAQILGDPNRWNSHSRGIFRKNLESDEIGLKINRLEDNPELQMAVGQYYDLFVDFSGLTGMEHAVHTRISGIRRV